MAYRGRFAPSPTGPLHGGSLVAALASWLDARAHGGQWLVRIEDVDTPRCAPGMDQFILGQLAAVGLVSDEPPLVQSQRSHLYQQALDDLVALGLAYPCRCSRKDVVGALALQGRARKRQGELVYPGTCRNSGAVGARHRNERDKDSATAPGSTQTSLQCKPQPAWRLRTDFSPSNEAVALVHSEHLDIFNIANHKLLWHDRRLGSQQQDIERTVGDFPLKRADGCFTYQLAVVVDDAAQGITHVVRGEDLADNTARQILLQCELGLPTPAYLHTPLVLGADGEKLSKQNGAQALDTSQPQAALHTAAKCLGLTGAATSAPAGDALLAWVTQWRELYNPAGD